MALAGELNFKAGRTDADDCVSTSISSMMLTKGKVSRHHNPHYD